jgi:putative transposase
MVSSRFQPSTAKVSLAGGALQTFRASVHLGRVGLGLGAAALAFVGTAFQCRTELAAENLFFRKHLAVYRERHGTPGRASDAIQLALVLLARCFGWREVLTIGPPVTLLRGHRQAFRRLWRRRSRSGRPRLPAELQRLIADMARDNRTWGEERIAAELLVKLGLRVSPRPARHYMGRRLGGGGRGATGPRWATFVRNHAQALVAVDFCVAVTATCRGLDVFVALEVGSRRLAHLTGTSHPTAAWTLEQFWEILAAPHAYRFVLKTATEATRPGLTRPSPRWASGSSALRSRDPARTPSGTGYSEVSAAVSGLLDFTWRGAPPAHPSCRAAPLQSRPASQPSRPGPPRARC